MFKINLVLLVLSTIILAACNYPSDPRNVSEWRVAYSLSQPDDKTKEQFAIGKLTNIPGFADCIGYEEVITGYKGIVLVRCPNSSVITAQAHGRGNVLVSDNSGQANYDEILVELNRLREANEMLVEKIKNLQ